MNILTYKEYLGRFEYDDEGEMYSGEVIGLGDMITFQGGTIDELEKAFRDSIDDYLNWQKEIDETLYGPSIFVNPSLGSEKDRYVD